MKLFNTLALLIGLSGQALAQQAYYSNTVSTTTGRATMRQSGSICVAASSQTPNTCTVTISGPGGTVDGYDVSAQFGSVAASTAAISAATGTITDNLNAEILARVLGDEALAASTTTLSASTASLASTKADNFTGISSACPAGYYLSSATFVNGVTTGGGCVAAGAGDMSTNIVNTLGPSGKIYATSGQIFVDGYALADSAWQSTMVYVSGSWQVPATSSMVYVSMCGAGGGGAGGNLGRGGGGGAGETWFRVPINVGHGAVITITIGAGGSGGSASTGGTDGSTTTISWTALNGVSRSLSAAGGEGATWTGLPNGGPGGCGNHAEMCRFPGTPNVTSTTTYLGYWFPGASGANTAGIGGSSWWIPGGAGGDGGGGGSSFWDYGGNGGVVSTGSPGGKCAGGGGGSGAGAGHAGANGGSGMVVFDWIGPP